MAKTNYKLVMAFIAVEWGMYGIYCMFSIEGLAAFRRLDKDMHALTFEIDQQQVNVEKLKKSLADWKEHSFASERVMREELQYAYPDEELYKF